MEGKETRFGIAASSTWAAFTTAASNGSVNSMHDSYTPLAGMVTMLLMQLGEVIFGGVGCGLYGMLAFAILAVFIAGLMVLARLRVTQRRLSLMTAEMFTASSVFVNGKLKVDYAGGCAYLDENELHLTPIEYKLLCLLSKNVGKVLTHTFITQNIWGRSWDNDVASLRVFMATLRKKLEPTEESPQYIQTHIGVGYRMIKVN